MIDIINRVYNIMKLLLSWYNIGGLISRVIILSYKVNNYSDTLGTILGI